MNINGIKPFFLEFYLLNDDNLQSLVDMYEQDQPINLYEVSDFFDLIIKADSKDSDQTHL